MAMDTEDWDAYEGAMKAYYLDMDWEELPEEAKNAATTLGLDQNSWDNDVKVPSFDKDWQDLSQDEKRAANVLGWDEEEWCDEYENRRLLRAFKKKRML